MAWSGSMRFSTNMARTTGGLIIDADEWFIYPG